MTIDQPQSDSEKTLIAGDSTVTGDPASLSEMLEVLSRRPRRRIFFHLLHEDEAVPAESLARAVATSDFSPVADGEEPSDGRTA
ncbi:hypothetical protein [Natrinema gelatinilyticum]|uniref:hypothetical protein n=1 Tax=Natrinema gelatinilyticum TaxID=2961571 RepID=UPI0020C4C6F9|nr:hypothetical protein [Natrinema gelatinilyticum]